jgi:hypothetical protein
VNLSDSSKAFVIVRSRLRRMLVQVESEDMCLDMLFRCGEGVYVYNKKREWMMYELGGCVSVSKRDSALYKND